MSLHVCLYQIIQSTVTSTYLNKSSIDIIRPLLSFNFCQLHPSVITCQQKSNMTVSRQNSYVWAISQSVQRYVKKPQVWIFVISGSASVNICWKQKTWDQNATVSFFDILCYSVSFALIFLCKNVTQRKFWTLILTSNNTLIALSPFFTPNIGWEGSIL